MGSENDLIIAPFEVIIPYRSTYVSSAIEIWLLLLQLEIHAVLVIDFAALDLMPFHDYRSFGKFLVVLSMSWLCQKMAFFNLGVVHLNSLSFI